MLFPYTPDLVSLYFLFYGSLYPVGTEGVNNDLPDMYHLYLLSIANYNGLIRACRIKLCIYFLEYRGDIMKYVVETHYKFNFLVLQHPVSPNPP